MRFIAIVPALALLTACNGDDDNPDDTGDQVIPGGCIQVEGGQAEGYLNFADAVVAAAGGSKITLCENGMFEQVLEVSDVMVIDAAGTQFLPPVNESAVVISDGGDLTISNASVVSTRSAFVVETGGALNLSLSDLAEVPNYGVDVRTGATAVIDEVTMNAPGWGGVKVSGGELTLTNTLIQNPGAYGVYAENDAVVTLTGNTIDGALHNDTSTSLWDIDGVGVWLETGATATLSGNQIVNSAIANVSAEDTGPLTMDGDLIGGGYAGMTLKNVAVDLSNVNVDGYFQYGIICLDCPDVTLHSTIVQTTPEGSAPFDNVGDDARNGSIGLFGIEADIVVTGTPEAPSQFNGNNQAGIIVQPQGGGDTALLNISDSEIRDNVGTGMSIREGELTMTDSVVSGTMNDDANCITDTGYACNMGLALWGSNATLVNSGVMDSEDWGLTIVNGVVDITGGTFGGNETYGIFTQTASFNIDGTTFDGGRRTSVYMNQNSTGVIDNATFQNAQFESSFEYTSGENLIRSVSYYQADDVLAYDSELVIRNTTFQDGESGVTGYGFNGEASITIQDSTFTRYNSDPIFSGTGSKFTVDRVNFSQVGQRAVYCSSGQVSLDKVRIDDTTKYKYKNEQYVNGELDRTTEFESTSYAVYGYQCDYSFEDVVIDGTDGQVMYADSCALEADGLSISNAMRDGTGTTAMQLSWRDNGTETGFPSAYLNDVSITGVGDFDAMRISSWVDSTNGELAAGTVSLTGLTIEGNPEALKGGTAIDVTDIGDLRITGLDVSDTLIGARLTRTNANITGAGGANTGTIATAGDAGIYIDADRTPYSPASVTLADLSVTNAAGDGIYVSSGTHSFTGISVTSAGDYGAECVDAAFDVCEASLDGASGAHLGCDACVD